MDRIEKFLKRLSIKEREIVESIIKDILSQTAYNLDVKKLKGEQNLFRVRKGNIRVVFFKKGATVHIVFIGRRNEKMYKFLK